MISCAEIETFSKYDSRKIIGVGLTRAYARNPGFVTIYADVGSRFNLDSLREIGGRCINTGIAEQSMLGTAAGFAHEGVPVCAIAYAPFITGRVFDQIKANVGEMLLPIKMIGAISGFSSGGLGPLTTCFDDIAMMRTIPGLTVVSPADCLEAVKCIELSMGMSVPIYIRMTGGKQVMPIYDKDYSFEIGKAIKLRKGKRILVISTGAVTSQVLIAADRLSAEGRPVEVLNMHTVKPLDTETLEEYMGFEAIVTVEEHSIYGGLGGAVAECLAQKSKHPRLVRLGVQDRYLVADHYQNLLDKAGLSEERIYQSIRDILS